MRYKGRLCVPIVVGLQEISWIKLIVLDIPFIRVAQRCTTILEKFIGGKV